MTKIASSGSVDGLTKLLNEYFYSDKWIIRDDLTLFHPDKDLRRINDYYKVKKTKGRFVLYHT